MHAETDRTLYWQTMSRLTGHSVRYLRVRSAVRRTLAVMLTIILPAAYAYALTK